MSNGGYGSGSGWDGPGGPGWTDRSDGLEYPEPGITRFARWLSYPPNRRRWARVKALLLAAFAVALAVVTVLVFIGILRG